MCVRMHASRNVHVILNCFNWDMDLKFDKIIHQTAFNLDRAYFIKKCIRTLSVNNVEWSMCFYADDDWKNVFESSVLFPWQFMYRYITGIQRSDIFRCAALYEMGGCYADVDMFSVRPLDSLIHSACEMGLVNDDTEMILTIDHPIHSRKYYGRQKIYMNNFMMAKPGARFLEIYLKAMKQAVAHGPLSTGAPVHTTGPVAMTRLIHEHGGPEALKIAVVPYFWINPLPDMSIDFPEKPIYQKMIEDGSWRSEFAPYLIHCWWHSWCGVETESYYQRLFDYLPVTKPAAQPVSIVS